MDKFRKAVRMAKKQVRAVAGTDATTGEILSETQKRQVLARKNFNKLFCVGYNKTGTTTLQHILKTYGFKLPNQQEQEARLTNQCFSTNYLEFNSFVNSYDAFQDMPFSQGLTFVAADSLFPQSKFILSERDSESWFKSMTSFHQKIFSLGRISELSEKDVLEKYTYLYPGYSHLNKTRHLSRFDGDKRTVNWDKLYDKDYYISMYEERNHQVKKYFMDAPGKLLVINLTKEKTTQKICEFLNIPSEFIFDMPHENKT